MKEKPVSVWELGEPFFKGVAGVYNLSFNGEQLALEVDDKGRFNWGPNDKIPIGIYARRIAG